MLGAIKLLNKFNYDRYKVNRNNLLTVIFQYFNNLKVGFTIIISLIGFFIFLLIINQIISGIMLSFSLMSESLLISHSREEEDIENLYNDDFFWLHERGVDYLVIAVYGHFFRKIFLGVNALEQEHSWKSGILTFFILQFTIFAGLILCNTHLSEITIIIVTSALNSFFGFIGKPFWWLFTDTTLNTDTIIRLAYFHYIIAFYLLFLSVIHGIDMHYDWKTKIQFCGIKQQLNWFDEVLANEFYLFINYIGVIFIFTLFLYSEPEALNYELFMWGDVGIVTDVRFYSVAPHWYFRPFMAWLIACPYYFVGVFGLVFLFLVTYYQTFIFCDNELENIRYSSLFFGIKSINNWNQINYEYSAQWIYSYTIFIICILYTLSFLPYGRFYNKVGGNAGLLLAYCYIFGFFSFNSFRNLTVLSNSKINLLN